MKLNNPLSPTGFLFVVFCLLISPVLAQDTQLDSGRKYSNPIIRGYHPDPSICRVGEDYYLVHSSNEYFPGIPIYHSRDLVNWQQIGHVLDRPSQLNLDGIKASAGIWAPTIRYHDGTFYVITTLGAPKGGNFYVTATNPQGPWSEPRFIPDAPGIDPDIFFDDDGKAYYSGNDRPEIQSPDTTKLRTIWVREINLKTGEWVGERKNILTEGAFRGASSAEGPHIYKKDKYYYLIIAEGGTGVTHSATVFRSKNIYGPYESNKKNPIITHRHLGEDFPIACIGHADLVKTQNGEWWMVLLGARVYGDFDYNLGRETFLTPVTWEGGWPVVNAGYGQVTFTGKAPKLKEHLFEPKPSVVQFDTNTLGFEWNFIRTPRENFWSLTERAGWLRLKLRPEKLTEQKSPSAITRRITEFKFNASTSMNFSPKKDGESAGMVILMSNNFHYRFEVIKDQGAQSIRLTLTNGGKETIIAEKNYNEPNVYLKIWSSGPTEYHFDYATNKDQWIEFKHNVDARVLSKRNTQGFTGTMVGLYASSNGQSSDNVADFDWFEYSAE